MRTDISELALVLAPLTETEFFNQFWEKDPLHISRSERGHFNHLVSLDAIETLLSTQSLQYPTVQLTRSGGAIAVSDYTDDSNRILPLRLIEEHDNGATIVISQAHEKIPTLADFRRGIQRDFRLRCQTNLYLSPPRQQGFNAHYDSHDVFILQVQGLKTFNFYEGGVELPFEHDSFDAKRHKAGALTQSITLHPGDTLYIPRGVMHDAVAGDDTEARSAEDTDKNTARNETTNTTLLSSLHITLGVYALTHRDLLIEAIQEVTTEDSSFRKSVPRHWLTDACVKQTNNDQESLASSMPFTEMSDECLFQALRNLQDKTAIDSPPNCFGSLNPGVGANPNVQNKAARETSGPKPVMEEFQVHLANVLSIERLGRQLRLRTHGSVLEFSDASRIIVELFLQGDVPTRSQLADFTDEEIQHVFHCLTSANILKMRDS